MQETPSKQLYTYEDYLKINDDNQYELIGGELILVPAPRTSHQELSGKIYRKIADFIENNNLGKAFYAPIDVILSKTEKPQPDILFISKDRLNTITEKNIQGAPDLVVEILSPSTTSRDKVEKSRLYYKYGVKEYWIIDPDAKIVEVFTPGEKNWNVVEAYRNDEILTSPLLPGLQINLVNVF
jgi:Uma2 family endonuclease